MSEELTEDLLSAYADDELDETTRDAVAARLRTDESWRAVLAEVEEARALLRGAPVRDAPPGFWDDVRTAAAVDDEEGRAAASVTRLRARRRARWSIAAVAAAAAVLVAVVLVPTRPHNRPAVATMVNTHAARASLTDEPVSTLSPLGGPVQVGR